MHRSTTSVLVLLAVVAFLATTAFAVDRHHLMNRLKSRGGNPGNGAPPATPGATPAPVNPKGGHAAGGHGPHWNYAKKTTDWPALKFPPDKKNECGGTQQSPIPLMAATQNHKSAGGPGWCASDPKLPDQVRLDKPTYGKHKAFWHNDKDHHSCYVYEGPIPKPFPPAPKTTFGTVTYKKLEHKALQLHVHTPFEHSVKGINDPKIELHVVHKTADEKSAVVLGVLFTIDDKAGPNPFFAALQSEKIPAVGNTLDLPANALDLNLLAPAFSGEYYHYVGSLTTPPCSEGINFFIFTKPLTATAAQVKVILDTYKGADYPNGNSRPLQNVGKRDVHLVSCPGGGTGNETPKNAPPSQPPKDPNTKDPNAKPPVNSPPSAPPGTPAPANPGGPPVTKLA